MVVVLCRVGLTVGDVNIEVSKLPSINAADEIPE